jgi:Protein of unknown function DUF262
MGESPEMDVPVEVGDEDLATGVEAERESVEERRTEDPFDPAQIDVVTRAVTVELLLARLRRGALDISPDYHRLAGAWDAVNRSQLIESLLLRIPLPALYAAEVGDESWAIVDGVQRLDTIFEFVAPELIDAPPLRLRGLEYLSQFEEASFRDLPGAMQTRIIDSELIIHIIRSGTPEPVMFNILSRLNRGGRPWSAQELRHALIPGPARVLIRELAESDSFLSATRGTVKSIRMADAEMVLRFLSFRLLLEGDYGYPSIGDSDAFLRAGMRVINDMSPEKIDELRRDFARAMRAAEDIFGKYAFRKHYRNQHGQALVNRALFEAESVSLARLTDEQLAVLRDRRHEVQERIIELMEDPRFRDSISVATGTATRVSYRFGSVEEMLRRVLAK